jgi:hypothetical protein
MAAALSLMRGHMARVFISYSHHDKTWKEQVAGHLAALPGVEVWDDSHIPPGECWADHIEDALAACDLAVLLISTDFLTSEFIRDTEAPALRKMRKERGLKLIPVIVRPCQWKTHAWLQALEARPKEGSLHEAGALAEKHLSDLAGEVHGFLVGAGLTTQLPSPVRGRCGGAVRLNRDRGEIS